MSITLECEQEDDGRWLAEELRTLVWPHGADFAPEFLRSTPKVAA